MKITEVDTSSDFPEFDRPTSILSWAEIQRIENACSTDTLQGAKKRHNVVSAGLLAGADEGSSSRDNTMLPPSLDSPGNLQQTLAVDSTIGHDAPGNPNLVAKRRLRFLNLHPSDKPSSTPLSDSVEEPMVRPDIATSPIDNLPNELVAAIFLWCFPGGTMFPLAGDHSPLTLCKVCSRWKAIADKVPGLWNDVSLVGQEMFYLRSSVYKIPRWFSRCENSLLTLHVRCTPEPWFKQMRQHIAELLILPHVSRLRELTLLSTAIYAPYLSGPASDLNSLEILHLADDAEPDGFAIDTITVFDHLPRLRTYIHSSRLAHQNTSRMPRFIPWHQLTVLDLSHTQISMRTCWDILFKCHRLVECTIHVDSRPCRETYSPTHTIFPSLLDLSITIHGADDCTGLLQKMVVPSLKNFAFMGTAWSHEIFMGLSERSSFALRTFVISGDCSKDDAYEVLKSHRTLTKASFLSGALLSSPMMDMIARGEIAPRVRILSCGSEDTGAATRMLLARSAPSTYNKDGVKISVASCRQGIIRVPEIPNADQLVQLKWAQDASPKGVYFALHIESRPLPSEQV